MQLTWLALTCSVAAVTACGGNGGHHGDGGINPLGVDALAACDYTETSDATSNMAPEATGLTIGTTTRTVCGQIQGGHYDSTSKTADVHTYTVTVAATTAELIVQFENQKPMTLTDFSVQIFDTSAAPTLLYAGDYTGALADHGAYVAALPAGSYNVVTTASANADVGSAIPYKVRFVADAPTTRCPDLTGMAADYVEAHDGTSNTGNDVVMVDFTKFPSFTMTTYASTAEATGLTISTTKNAHVTGSSAMVAAGTDKYLDRDTFGIMTGSDTNELSVRLNWPGSTADLDYIVFPASSIGTANVAATLTSTSQDEFATFAVRPNTAYWLWVGAYAGSTGLPVAYSATVCGDQFTP